MRTRQVTQFGPVRPSPLSLVIAPSHVLINKMVGFSAMMKMSQMKQKSEEKVLYNKVCRQCFLSSGLV